MMGKVKSKKLKVQSQSATNIQHLQGNKSKYRYLLFRYLKAIHPGTPGIIILPFLSLILLLGAFNFEFGALDFDFPSSSQLSNI